MSNIAFVILKYYLNITMIKANLLKGGDAKLTDLKLRISEVQGRINGDVPFTFCDL
jgi:hypothetical protein